MRVRDWDLGVLRRAANVLRLRDREERERRVPIQWGYDRGASGWSQGGEVVMMEHQGPVEPRMVCRDCEPDTDPIKELVIFWPCETHWVDPVGSEDATVFHGESPSGSAEAGGESNRAWCEFFHRRKDEKSE